MCGWGWSLSLMLDLEPRIMALFNEVSFLIKKNIYMFQNDFENEKNQWF